MEHYLTYKERIEYNKGVPIKCVCGRIIGFIKDGKPYVICHGCRGAVNIVKGKSD